MLPRLDRTASAASREGTDADRFDPVEHLREYNSYLTPRLGLASGDTWTLVAIMVRNLLLNWLLIVPLLMAVLMLPRILVSLLQVAPPGRGDPFPGFDTLQLAVVGLGVLSYGFATYSGFGALPTVGGRAMTQARFVAQCLVPVLASTFLLVVGSWWVWDDLGRVPTLPELALAGLLLAFLSWLAHLVVYDLFRDPRLFLRRLFGPLSPASAIFGLASGAAVYVITHVLFETSRNEDDPSFYAALAPALLLGGLLLGTGAGRRLHEPHARRGRSRVAGPLHRVHSALDPRLAPPLRGRPRHPPLRLPLESFHARRSRRPRRLRRVPDLLRPGASRRRRQRPRRSPRARWLSSGRPRFPCSSSS